jgi:hypothetical protein
MPNVQQPEMRRSGRDPLVQDSTEQRAQNINAEGNTGGGRRTPDAQRSPHEPPPAGKRGRGRGRAG